MATVVTYTIISIQLNISGQLPNGLQKLRKEEIQTLCILVMCAILEFDYLSESVYIRMAVQMVSNVHGLAKVCP